MNPNGRATLATGTGGADHTNRRTIAIWSLIVALCIGAAVTPLVVGLNTGGGPGGKAKVTAPSPSPRISQSPPPIGAHGAPHPATTKTPASSATSHPSPATSQPSSATSHPSSATSHPSPATSPPAAGSSAGVAAAPIPTGPAVGICQVASCAGGSTPPSIGAQYVYQIVSVTIQWISTFKFTLRSAGPRAEAIMTVFF